MSTINLLHAETGYNLSFTAASLRSELTRIVAECYLDVGDGNLAKDRILKSNALQCRITSSAIRLKSEMLQRIGSLIYAQIILVANATAENRAAIAWLSVCKRIRFAFEFTAEVLRDKLAVHDVVLRPSHYESYVEHKNLAHPEIPRLTTSSKSKVRQVLLRMLTEAGILKNGSEFTIQRWKRTTKTSTRGNRDDFIKFCK